MGIVDGICEIPGCKAIIRYDPTANKRRCLQHLDEAHARAQLAPVSETLAEFNARSHAAHTIVEVL